MTTVYVLRLESEMLPAVAKEKLDEAFKKASGEPYSVRSQEDSR